MWLLRGQHVRLLPQRTVRLALHVSQQTYAGWQVIECPGGKFTITASIVDTKTWGYIQRELMAPHFIRDAVEQWREQNKPGSDRITANLEAMDGHLGRLRASVDNLSLAIEEAREAEARTTLTRRLDEVTKQIRTVEQEKRDMLTEREDYSVQETRIASLVEWAKALGDELPNATYRQKRLFLHALRVRVRVWRADHTPRFVIRYDFRPLRAGVIPMVIMVDDQGNRVDCDDDNR